MRIIVATGPGGGADITARHVAKTMSERLRQNVVVENRPGAGSSTGAEYAARATPDGHNLLFTTGSSMVMKGRLFAPAATPRTTVDGLRTLIATVLLDADFRKRIEAGDGRIMNIPPQQQQSFLKGEIECWGALIKRHAVVAE